MPYMFDDPHEPAARETAYSKNESDEIFLRVFNERLKGLPEIETRSETNPEYLPLIYIVGVPRSGTTLLAQLVAKYLPVGYIDNLIARFWLNPAVGIRLSRIVQGDSPGKMIEFRSRHGVTPGPSGPHEFGYFWRHWLNLDQARTHNLTEKNLTNIDKAGLANVLREEILSSFGLPVMFKNPICGLQAPFLSEIHQRSLFVQITRNPVSTAASILKSRKERYGNYESWWSLKPSSWPFAGAGDDPVEQVCRQVAECQQEIMANLSVPTVRSLTVSYEGLCEAPEEVLDSIVEKMADMGWEMRRSQDRLPELAESSGPQLPAAMMERIESYFADNIDGTTVSEEWVEVV